MRLRVPFGSGFRRARLNGRRVRTDCVACCSDSPWYIKGIACVYGTLSGACAEAARPDIWICVNAITSNGQTVRERYGSSASATFTVLYNGACYRATYRPLDDSGLTATEEQAIASGLDRIACNEVVNDTPVDCNDPACPRGLGFVEASLCRPGEGANAPRVFVCSAAITEACTFNYLSFCYCIKPGIGVGIGSIPTNAIVFYTSPCVTVDGIHTQRTCCQCLAGCTWSPLRGDYSRICCCGTMTLVAYAAGWRVRRTQSTGSYQEWTGNATRGTPDANGQLPYTATFTSVAPSGQVLVSQRVDGFLTPLDANCGFNPTVESNLPPPTWCHYGSCTQDPQYNLPAATGMQYLTPSFPDAPNRTGTLTGVSNASCNSIAAQEAGVVQYTYDDGVVETLDARYNINLTYNVVVPESCRGDCLDVGSQVYIAKPESVADAIGMLP